MFPKGLRCSEGRGFVSSLLCCPFGKRLLAKVDASAALSLAEGASEDVKETGQARQQVMQSERVRTYIDGTLATRTVSNRIRAAADVGLCAHRLDSAQLTQLDTLWSQLDEALGRWGVDVAASASSTWSTQPPTVEAIIEACDETPIDAPLCTLTLLPLPGSEDSGSGTGGGGMGMGMGAASMSMGSMKDVIHFCGAPYYAPCVNLWVNYVSNSPPVAMPMAAAR